MNQKITKIQNIKPEIWLFMFCVLQTIVWSTLSCLLRHNIPFDTIEGVAWGLQWQLGYDKEQLAEVGADLGSDVPIFLAGPMCQAKGRGERVADLGFEWPFWAVLFSPGKRLDTAKVYEKFDELLIVL